MVSTSMGVNAAFLARLLLAVVSPLVTVKRIRQPERCYRCECSEKGIYQKQRKEKHMKNRIGSSILATSGAVLLAAGITFAGFPGIHHSSRKSADIEITETTKVPGGPSLEPGTYKVVLLNESDTPEVGFYQDGKLIGQASVKLDDQGKKFQHTEFEANILDGNREIITALSPGGWTEKIIFSVSDASSTSGQ